jgi:hypothetical protein
MYRTHHRPGMASVEEASENQSRGGGEGGWCEEEVNPMHEVRGPWRHLISGADCLAVCSGT